MRRTILLSAAALLLAGRAFAATLDTAPISATFGHERYLICLVQNTSPQPKTVTMSVLNFSGSPVVGPLKYTVEAGQSQSIAANPVPGAASCRFVVAGSANSVHASASYYDPDTNRSEIALPAE